MKDVLLFGFFDLVLSNVFYSKKSNLKERTTKEKGERGERRKGQRQREKEEIEIDLGRVKKEMKSFFEKRISLSQLFEVFSFVTIL